MSTPIRKECPACRGSWFRSCNSDAFHCSECKFTLTGREERMNADNWIEFITEKIAKHKEPTPLPEFVDKPLRGRWKWDDEQKKLVPYYGEPIRHAHGIVTDECQVKSMADGKIYTSKSALRRSYKRLGFVEVGNEKSWDKPRERPANYEKELQDELGRAYYDVRDGNAPLSELDKARCEIINKQIRDNVYDNRERDESGNPRE